ncbi:mycofactocin-associated electron transfer flavoprotein alpha subunit [Prauserella muralis]|uniref:Electron transfer flavoprotein subunit alpha n=1 Tax=Prauserella muralis TaxID=588067 RepID=A0A2V4AY94_9PSEU|nr:mycofactocin-associated electron transfer flavoprotein alpha subunit [Prauserella muralis]PXY26971.1 electron transfer flavoprotein subunit alpha [Prauserella muralis]TWE23413.1 electron transfer flavoprotein alpha subunit apoprotein [Prauserella muralis]
MNGFDTGTLAVLVVRGGVPPLGGDEAVAEAGGAALLVGTGCADAVTALPPLRRAWCAEAGGFAAGAWSRALAPLLEPVGRLVLPASADGRDLAPRLAAELGRPLLAGAVRVGERCAELARRDGRLAVTVETSQPFVATLVPGVRGALPYDGTPDVGTVELTIEPGHDARVLEVLEPDPATADLAEAPRILGAGAGLARGPLSGPDAVALLGRVAAALGASVGATRVVTDAGWAPYERQIGTTGVVVDPEVYVAFGVSGATQHTGGLGTPRHVVSVNTDASSPMTAMADLGLVTDAQALLRELARRLESDDDA